MVKFTSLAKTTLHHKLLYDCLQIDSDSTRLYHKVYNLVLNSTVFLAVGWQLALWRSHNSILVLFYWMLRGALITLRFLLSGRISYSELVSVLQSHTFSSHLYLQNNVVQIKYINNYLRECIYADLLM